MMALEQSITIAILVLVVMAIVALLVFTLRIKGTQQQQLQGQATIQADLRALCNAAVQVGERVNRIEGGLKALQQRQQELGVRQDHMVQGESQEVSFEQAIKMARKGSSVEELMEICNLSRGEAELIGMMHRLDPGR
jgi:uncharacterized protein YpmB